MDRPSSDRPLDEQIVSGLIAAQFPDLPVEPVTRLGAGWDHELFTAGEWIWRFPRRAECVAWLTREIEVMAVVAGTLGSMIPVFEWIGEASDAFPYPFVGYRRLAGVGADQIAADDNDICPDHLIVDPGTGRLVGLIDFTDAMVGEPVLDFAGLIGVGGYRFINRVAERYDLPLGDGSGAKLRWLSRVLTLTWLAYTATDQPADVPKHLSWVARAFGALTDAQLGQGR